MGELHYVTGASLAALYRFVSIAGFVLAALGIYALARGLGASLLASFFAGAWLLLNPGAYVIFEVGAHPEGVALAFAAGALLAHRTRRHALAAVLMGVGMLVKPLVAFVAAYGVLDLIADPSIAHTRTRMMRAAQYVVAVAVGFLAPYVLVPSVAVATQESIVPVLLTFTEKRAVFGLLYNFDVLWLLWGAALVVAGHRERARFLVVGGLLVVVLFWNAIDWWRVPYGVLAVFVLPAAAAFLGDRFERSLGAIGTWCVFAGVTALLLRLPARFDWNSIETYSMWPYAVVAAAPALNEGYLGASGAASPAGRTET